MAQEPARTTGTVERLRAERRAEAVWAGSLFEGSGSVSAGSRAFAGLPITWASRTERADGRTSPEELLAAAHASCYCMALSHELAQADTPPERLEATATVGFVAGEGVKFSHLVVNGRVPGIDQARFEEAARAAGEGCPISGALKGNIEITVDATLAS